MWKRVETRNQAARELKLPPFIGIGVQKVGCSWPGDGGCSSYLAPGRGWTGTGNVCGRGSLCQDEMLGYEGGVGA